SILESMRKYQKVGGKDLILDLVEKFLEDLPQRARAMKVAMEQDDPRAMVAPAHAIKSAARVMGAVRLAHLCTDLEAVCLAGERGKMRDLYATVQTELGDVSTELRTIFRAGG